MQRCIASAVASIGDAPDFRAKAGTWRSYGEPYGTRTKQDRDIDTGSCRSQIVVNDAGHAFVCGNLQAIVRRLEELNFVVLQCLTIDVRMHRNRLHIRETITDGQRGVDDGKP